MLPVLRVNYYWRKVCRGHKLLKIIEKRYRAGRVTSVDVEEIKATQIAEKSSILEAKANLNSQMAQLAALVNQTPEHVEQIKTDSLVEPKMLVKSESQWLKLSMDKSPELLAAVQSVNQVSLSQ